MPAGDRVGQRLRDRTRFDSLTFARRVAKRLEASSGARAIAVIVERSAGQVSVRVRLDDDGEVFVRLTMESGWFLYG